MPRHKCVAVEAVKSEVNHCLKHGMSELNTIKNDLNNGYYTQTSEKNADLCK